MMSASIKQVEKKVDISIYMKPEAPDTSVVGLKSDIENLPELKDGKVKYLSKEKVKENFKEKSKSKKASIDALELVGNPFGSTINISANSVSDYNKINDFIFSNEMKVKYGDIIESSNYENVEEAITKLKFLIKYFNKGGYILSIILAVIAFLVTYNTLVLVLHSKKEEIEVMRLVGASRFFAKAPFIFSGILYGFVSGIISVLIIRFGIERVSPILNEAFIFNLSEYYSQNFIAISGTIVLTGIAIGFVASYLAVMRYIRI
jgi:cell division transport system permease protein